MERGNGILRLAYLCLPIMVAGCNAGRVPPRLQASEVAVLSVVGNALHDYGSQWVEAHADQLFTVTNTGKSPASAMSGSFNLSLNFEYAGGSFPGEGGNCGATLAPGESCQVVVRFSPQYVGTFEEILTVDYHNGLQATRVAQPTLKGKGKWENGGVADSTFSGDGIVSVVDGSSRTAAAVAVLSDRRILTGGTWFNGMNLDFFIARHLPDGTRDGSFGTGGVRGIAIGNEDDRLRGFATQLDGKWIAVGEVSDGGMTRLGLVRISATGDLDLSFGGAGRAVVTDAAHLRPVGVWALPDKRYLVAGTRDDGVKSSFFLMRFEANGARDVTFAGTGIALAEFAGAALARSMALVNGKVMIVGVHAGDFAAVRFTVDGALDAAFDGDGKISVDINGSVDDATMVRAQSDGKLVFVGRATGVKSEMAVLRLNANGTVDTSFGSNGRVTVSLSAGVDQAATIYVQPDGYLLLGGTSDNSLAFARLAPNGTLDSTFGLAGKAVVSLGVGVTQVRAYAVQPNGKPLFAGRFADEAFLFRLWP